MYRLLKLKEGQNKCPFTHYDDDGKAYFEKNESSGLSKGRFNCFVCSTSATDEDWFTAQYLKVSYNMAKRFNAMLKEMRTFVPTLRKWTQENQQLLKFQLEDKESREYKYLFELGLIDETKESITEFLKNSRMGMYMNNLAIPYIYKGQIINITRFNFGREPKYINLRGTVNGVIATTRRFSTKKDYILITAGEKDMLLATKNKFNALTVLGGEATKPFYFKELFKDKKVYIAYDNDKAGREGAESLAEWLYNYTRTIKILNIGDTYEEKGKSLKSELKEDREDITDYFVKYKKSPIQLWQLIDDTKWWQPPAIEHKSVIELIQDTRKLLNALAKEVTKPENSNEEALKNKKEEE